MAGVIHFISKPVAKGTHSAWADGRLDSSLAYASRVGFRWTGPFTAEIQGGLQGDPGRFESRNVGDFRRDFFSRPRRDLYDGSLRLSFPLRSGSIELRGSLGNQALFDTADFPIPRGTSGNQVRGEAVATLRNSWASGWGHKTTSSFRLLSSSDTESDLISRLDIRSNRQEFTDLQFDSAWTHEGARLQVKFGIDALAESLRWEEIRGTNQSRFQVATYGQAKWNLGESTNLILLPGLRAVWNSQFGLSVSPLLAFLAFPDPRLQWRASWSYGFRAPTLKETHYFFLHPAPLNFLIEGSDRLQPEYAHSMRSSLRWAPSPALQTTVGGFLHLLENQIGYGGFQPGAGIVNGQEYNGRYRSTNLESGRKFGAEWEFEIRGGEFLRVGGSFVVQRSEERSNGIWLESVNRFGLSAKGEILLRIPVLKTELTLGARWHEGYLTNRDPFRRTEDFLDVSAGIVQPIGEALVMSFGIRNLLDAGTDFDAQRKGRTFYAGVRIRLEGAPGPGRR